MPRIYTFRRSLGKRAGISQGTGAGLLRPCQSDAVVGNESFWLGKTCRNAERGDGFAALDLAGDFQVQGEELGEQILLGVESVGVEDGGVQGSVGVFESVPNRGGGTMFFGARRVAERRVSRLRGGF
jgi:hypothetical protein